jgi:hypothetical protein
VRAGANAPDGAQSLVIGERERGRFARADIAEAAALLHIGPGGALGVELEHVDDAFLANALAYALRTVRTESDARAALDAFRVLAQARRSPAAMAEHDRRRARGWMTLDAAYRVLSASEAADDDMLIMVAQMEVRALGAPIARRADARPD